jgi:hypothetical protein
MKKQTKKNEVRCARRRRASELPRYTEPALPFSEAPKFPFSEAFKSGVT